MSPDRVMAIYRVDRLHDPRWNNARGSARFGISLMSMAAGITCYVRVGASGVYQRGAGHGVDKRNRVLSDRELSERISPSIGAVCRPLRSPGHESLLNMRKKILRSPTLLPRKPASSCSKWFGVALSSARRTFLELRCLEGVGLRGREVQ